MQMIFDGSSPNLDALFLQQMVARTRSFRLCLVYLATTVKAFALCDTYSKETVDNLSSPIFAQHLLKDHFTES